jgi:molecular chaperone GrpE
MAKQRGSNNALENAMAEALEAVERAEKNREEEDAGLAVPEDVVTLEASMEDPEAGAATSETEQDLRDQLLRLAADFENYRKRTVRQLEDTRRYGVEKVLSDILPVVDNLERALAHAEGDSSPMVEGVRMVTKQFLDVLALHGVQGFDSLGEAFDPERHEAMGQVPAGDRPPGSIIEEMLKGYFLHERLLRPAQVIVAAAGGESADGDNGRGD